MQNTTSLIILAKHPGESGADTFAGLQQTAEVFRQTTERTLMIAASLRSKGMTTSVLYDPPFVRDELERWIGSRFPLVPLSGDDEGMKVRNAFERAFAQGAEHVVLVATNVPDLDSAVLQDADRLLSAYDAVIGPTVSGRNYLIGLRKPFTDIFTGLRWDAETAYAETIVRLRRGGRTSVALPILRDVRSWNDYRAILGRLP